MPHSSESQHPTEQEHGHAHSHGQDHRHDHGHPGNPPEPHSAAKPNDAGWDLGLGSAVLWLDPFGGMAGDMFLAGLLDLGDSRFDLRGLLGLAEDLLPGEAQLTARPVLRQGLAGSHLEVRTPETHSAPHRGLADLLARVSNSQVLNARAKELAARVLQRLAEAEARVHAQTPESIHFHEVGAVDTLIDVCGAAYALQKLQVGRLFVSPPLLGSGTVHCAHGVLPVPPPATAELLRGLPVRPGGGGGERVTPTGAAILAAWGTLSQDSQVSRIQRVGYGAGTRDPQSDQGPANLLRVMLVESGQVPRDSTVWQMQVNLDDMTGEDVGHCVTLLREVGALDVWTASIDMKKDRPGVLLSVLVGADRRDAVEQVVFSHSSTFGVRWSRVERTECERRFETLDIDGETIPFKIRVRPRGAEGAPSDAHLEPCDVFPEFEDLRRLAELWKEPLWETRRRAIQCFLDTKLGR